MARQSLMPFGGNADPLLSFQRGMNRLFDDMFRGSGMPMASETQESGMIMPQVNVSETDNEIRITVELPGVAEKDVDVTLDDDVLTIRGEKRFEKKEDKENYHVVERSFGRFQRSLRVPHSIKADQVQAQVENGVLTVILPKNAAEEKTRHIQVRSGAAH
jgi:HSP20 family protein